MNTVANARLLLGVAAALAWSASLARGQAPGLPTLQNAFGNPGIAVAANVGSGFYGLAGALGIGSGRVQLSAGAGVNTTNGATRGAYGGRGAMTLWTSSGGGLGAAAFAGVGGAPRTRNGTTTTNGAELNVPAGITVGYRRAMGTTRGISAYLSPMYRWARIDTGVVSNGGAFRFAGGVDVALSPFLGVSAGAEFGSKAKGTTKQATLFGAAVTYALGRRQ